MSTLTSVVQPGVATQIAKIAWQDYGGDAFNTNIRVKSTTAIADLEAIAGAADVFSQAHICADGGLALGDLKYNITGQDAATNLLYARKTDILQFEFRSRVYCSARSIVQVPSPTEVSTTNIFGDSTGGERNVNLAHTAIAAFLTLVAAQLATTDQDVTDWYCVNGERITTSVDYAGKRPS